MARTFHLSILSATEKFYDGPCESLIIPASDGAYGVMAHHADTISTITPGILSYRLPGEEIQDVFVSTGMAKIEQNDVLVLVGTVERPEEIDENIALRAAEEAREALLQKKSVIQYRTAQAQLARAAGRLRTKHHMNRQGK